MAETLLIPLPDRALLSLSGAETRTFLQGLISNDVEKVGGERAIHAALLTPQGKYLHDFFVFDLDGTLVLDTEAARRDDLLRRLRLYKLRAKVDIAPADPRLAVYALIGPRALDHVGRRDGGLVYADPRLPALGARAAIPPATAAALRNCSPGGAAAYDRLRLELGIPDGSRDLLVEKSLLMENGFEELGGVDFDKGCFIGQEVTARMKHRALVKKRLWPVVIQGDVPAAGTQVHFGEVESGEMRSSAGGLGLALLRNDHVEAALKSGQTFTAGAARLTPRRPDWLATNG